MNIVIQQQKVLQQRSYTILDTSEDLAVLHVNHGDRGYGNVYISGKDGKHFTRSVTNNVRSYTGECEFDRIAGVEGIYLTNVKVRSNVCSDHD